MTGQIQSQRSLRQRPGGLQGGHSRYKVVHDKRRGTTHHQRGDSPSQKGRPIGNLGRTGAAHRETTHAKRRTEGSNHNWSTRMEEPQQGPIKLGRRVWVKEPKGAPTKAKRARGPWGPK